nr:putative nuclease REase [Diatraea saccharalis]
MRIRNFWKNIANELKPYELKNCNVVIDGQNFFYDLYRQSNLPSEFGSESDKYADYLRKFLGIFKKANIKCYFLFKGGDGGIVREKDKDDVNESKIFVKPIFMKDIYKQVLDEMDFDYVICEFESKRHCITLAQKLQCPLISFDVEFCFSGEPYIPINHNDKRLCYDDNTNSVHCELFDYYDFIKKYNLTKEKLATFILLTDEYIFSKHLQQNIIVAINIRVYNTYQRNLYLLNWLSKREDEQIKRIIHKYLQPDDINEFEMKKNKVIEFICKKVTPGIPIDYLFNDKHIEFIENDPLWFEKGVASGYVALRYVNIYHWNIIEGSWCLEDPEAEDAMFLSLGIIKYAFNLLTNFERKELRFVNNKNEVVTINTADETSIPKPTYEALQSPFENGWDQIKALRLFEHFLEKSLPNADFSILNHVPDNVRLLIIALVYFSKQKPENTTVEVCSVLLSYVILSVVAEKSNSSNNNKHEVVSRPYMDSFTDENLVTEMDSDIAKSVMNKYFYTDSTPQKLATIFDEKMIHPLIEFQHCFQNLYYLNKLCGSLYKDTIFSRTYNGTFVYQVVHTINHKYSGKAEDFVEKELSPAATVLAFFKGLKDIYNEIMHF